MTVSALTKPIHLPNEDVYLIEEKLKLFGVFDGVGGTKGGAAAAKIAVGAICEVVKEQIYKEKKNYKNILKQAFVQAAENIKLDGQIYGRFDQCTTATVVKISANLATIANVGDSRCYGLTKKGKIKRLTKDHGILEELVRGHQISPKIAQKIDQAKKHQQLTLAEMAIFSQRNIITKALSTDFDETGINFSEVDLKKFKMLILTTDGVHDNLTDAEIEKIVKKANTPKEVAKNLVEEAFEVSTQTLFRSKPDDITVVVVSG